MGLTNKKEEQLRKMPIVQARILKSKDGKYLIHRTEITTIRPMAYYEVILHDKEGKETAEVSEEEIQTLLNQH
ncbi:MAG: hypothetical protein ACP5N2_07735 [Candidatus Nanoarchaeia archaeon]